MRHILPDLAGRLAGPLTETAAAAAERNGVAIPAGGRDALRDDLAASLAGDPALAHAVNAEPWYRSRVTWGAVVAALAPLAGFLFGHELGADERSLVVDAAVAAGSLAGAALALYGRWVAKRPLGR